MGRASTVTQRVAAYGLVVRDARLLLVRLTALAPTPGHWSLPGGGIDFGEHPADAVVRELYEETGLHGQVREVLDVDSAVKETVIDQELVQRYHAVRILYRVEVDTDGPLEVVDTGGSSEAPTWHACADVGALLLTPIAALALHHLPGPD
jgi:8-oxo-dGTP diphosphatase